MIDAINHTVICEVIDGPIKYSAFKAIRLSNPVVLQPSDNNPAPKINIKDEEEYCEITSFIGTILNKALMITGKMAVTVICTGLVTHQRIIHKSRPVASLP